MQSPSKLDRLRTFALSQMNIFKETDLDMRECCLKDARNMFDSRTNKDIIISWEKEKAIVSVYDKDKLIGWYDVQKLSKTLGCWFQ